MAADSSQTDSLAELIRVAEAAGAVALAREARDAAQRLNEGRFFVAVLGQFKRGKSTLINAIVRAPVLPTGVAPVTSVITVLRHGAGAVARARFRDGAVRDIAPGELGTYVSESENPENVKGVLAVEVEIDAPVLERGLCFVDTPGLSSVFAGNTNETREFLPHVDAALVVVGADPPITADELQLVQTLGARMAELFVVISKADRVAASDLAEARAFTREVLRKALPGRDVPVFEVSAREPQDTRDWHRLSEALEDLAARSGAALVETARVRETTSLTARVRGYLDEALGALQRPVEETERRVAILARSADDADRALVELRHLFDAEQQRIARDLETRRVGFVSECQPMLARALEAELAAHGDDEIRQLAMERGRELVEVAIRTWRDDLRRDVERAFEAAARRFMDGADTLIAKIRAASPDATVADASGIDATLRARSGFYFRAMMTEAGASLASRIGDHLRSRDRVLAGAVADAMVYAERLLDSNSRGVTADYVDRIVESRRGIEAALQRTLRGAAIAAGEAAARARELHARGAAAVEAEIDRLSALRATLSG